MFKIENVLKSSWPKLSWVCILYAKTKRIKVFHGPMVEINENWLVEGVWNREFSSGDFDLTDLFFGSGLRLREKKIVFVSSGSTFDRLLYCDTKDKFFVSNTLPGLLQVSNMRLKDDYRNYTYDSYSIIRGLKNNISAIPTDNTFITKLYYKNLTFDLRNWNYIETDKPELSPDFDCYEKYSEYLFNEANNLGKNISCKDRKYKILPLSTISKGYDSCAASVVAKYAGCKKTVTIAKASSVWQSSDSGKEIAKLLGMQCKEYPRTSHYYPDEIALWAGEGRAGILNWTLFDYHKPLTLLFTGCHGEKVWDRVNHDHADPFVRRDTSSHGFCELRLLRGVFQTPVPFWGVKKSGQIKKITHQSDMKRFYLNKDYDKPIARRIVEEHGVPRRIFGMTNKNTSLESPFRWPYSNSSQKSFQKYLKKQGIKPLTIFQVKILRFFFTFYQLFYINLGKKFGCPDPKTIALNKIPGILNIYQWANHNLMRYYKL